MATAAWVTAAASARAATCPVICTGTGPHDAAISLALSCAGPAGRVVLSGHCQVRSAVTVALPGLTLAGTEGAVLERILPAPAPSFLTPGAAIVVGAGASGSRILGLDIRGAGDGVSTSPSSSTVPAGQPDAIEIRGCRIEAGRQHDGAAIHHVGMNGPPFNDIDACTGAPAGLSRGWMVADNELRSHRGSGIVHSGSDFLVTGNHIHAALYGIAAYNNADAPSVQPFGSAPANAGSLYTRNVIAVTSNAALPPDAVPAGIVDFGYPSAPLATPSPDGCDRGHSTLWEKNCITVTPDGLGGRSYGIGVWIGGQGNAEGSVRVEKNVIRVMAPLNGDPTGNVGVLTDGSRFALIEKNDFAGAGDFAFLSLRPDAEGNRYLDNRVGPGFHHEGHLVHDFGVPGTNCYAGNHYCHSHEEIEGEGADRSCGENRPGTTCSGVPAHCGSGNGP